MGGWGRGLWSIDLCGPGRFIDSDVLNAPPVQMQPTNMYTIKLCGEDGRVARLVVLHAFKSMMSVGKRCHDLLVSRMGKPRLMLSVKVHLSSCSLQATD